MRLCVVSSIAVLAGMSSAVFAQSKMLELDGVWGNEAGCAFHREQLRVDESMMLLKPDGVESYATGCEWVQVLRGSGTAQLATGICGYEGEAGLGAESFVIAPDMADATLMKIYRDGGDIWGEVRKCP